MRDLRRWTAACDLELAAWLGGLVWLAVCDPHASSAWSVCPLRLAGVDCCPGCGLGRAIGLLFHGELAASWQAHPLGIPAALALIGRVGVLLRAAITQKGAQCPT